jgi:hypothetical protein
MLDVGVLAPAPSAAENADVLSGGRQMVDNDAPDGSGAAGTSTEFVTPL